MERRISGMPAGDLSARNVVRLPRSTPKPRRNELRAPPLTNTIHPATHQMTQKQKDLYFVEWTRAKKAGQLKESDRHALHIQALGEDKSSKDFSNADLDKVLGAFRAISRPTSLNSQIRQIEQPQTRFHKRINDQLKCLGLFVHEPDAYLRTILLDRFHVEQISDLDLPNLKNLRNTLGDRIARFRREAEMTEHDMCARAGVPASDRAVPNVVIPKWGRATRSRRPRRTKN
jgi:hypothetical protein